MEIETAGTAAGTAGICKPHVSIHSQRYLMTEVTRSVPGNEQVRSVDDLNGDGLLNDWVTFDDVQRHMQNGNFPFHPDISAHHPVLSRYIGNQYAVFDEAAKKWTIKDSTSRHSVFGGTDEHQSS